MAAESFYVLLASNANLDEFPSNTLTQFTNLVPYIEQHDKFFIRIRRIAISQRLRQDVPHPAFVKVHLGELETNALQRAADRVLHRFTYNHDENLRGDYQVVDIDHAPFLRTRNVPLSQLSIKLTDNLNRVLQLDDGLPTLVSLELSTMDTEQQFTLSCMSHGFDERRTFTYNTLNKFHVRIPQEMTLEGWEVAVASVGIPPQSKPSSTMSFRVRVVDVSKALSDSVDDIYLSYQLRTTLMEELAPLVQSENMTLEDARAKLMEKDFFISREYQDARGMRQQRAVDDDDVSSSESSESDNEQVGEPQDEEEESEESPPTEETAEIDEDDPTKTNIISTEENVIDLNYDRTFTYEMSEFTSTTKVCQQIISDLLGDDFLRGRLSFLAPYVSDKYAFFNFALRGYRATFRLDFDPAFQKFLGEAGAHPTHILWPYAWLPFYRSTSVWRLKKPNVGMLYCDIVEPSIVSNQKLQLLHLIPFNLSQTHYLYEPKHLMYHRVVSRTFTDIGFQITQPDGEPYEISDSYGEDEAKLYGGVTVSLLFRPIPRK